MENPPLLPADSLLSPDMIRKRMEATILSELRTRKASLSVLQNDETCDLCILLSDDSIAIWKFLFFIPETAEDAEPAFRDLTSRLAYMKNDPNCKTSIVTGDEKGVSQRLCKPSY